MHGTYIWPYGLMEEVVLKRKRVGYQMWLGGLGEVVLKREWKSIASREIYGGGEVFVLLSDQWIS